MSIKIKTARLVAFMLAVALVFGTVPTSNIITTASAEETSLPTGDLAPITGIKISEYSTSGFGMKFFDWFFNKTTEASTTENAEYTDVTVADHNWSGYSSSYVFDCMNADEKRLYNNLDNICMEFIKSSDIDATYMSGSNYRAYFLDAADYSNLTSDEVQRVVLLFCYEHPQYYFASTTYLVSSSHVYLSCYDAFYKGSERASITNALFSKIDSMVSTISDGNYTYLELEKAAHDLICNKVSYKSNSYDQSIYSAVMLGKSVCAGYSATLELLLNAVNVPTVMAFSDSHAWNKVYLGNGRWYAVDTTWDDQKVYISYDFFNKSDSDIKKNDEEQEHTVASNAVNYLPAALYSLSGYSDGLNIVTTTEASTEEITTEATTENVTVTTTEAITTTTETTTTEATTTEATTTEITTEASDITANATDSETESNTDNTADTTTTETATSVKITTPAIKSIKGYKGRLKITFAKLSGRSYYTVVIATNKSFTRNKKTLTVSAGKSSINIKKLKSKRYYAKIRKVQYINGKKYISAWSKRRSVKVG